MHLKKREANMKLDKKSIQITDIEFWSKWKQNQGGMRISWACNLGFGELEIYKDLEGHFVTQTEHLASNENKQFIKAIMDALIDMLDVQE